MRVSSSLIGWTISSGYMLAASGFDAQEFRLQA